MTSELETALIELENLIDRLERTGRILTADSATEGRLFVRAIRDCPRVWTNPKDNLEALEDTRQVHKRLHGLALEVEAYRADKSMRMQA